MVNDEFGTSIHIQRMGLNWKGEVDLREIYIEDHHQDTLIYAKSLQTNILSIKDLVQGDLDFGFVDMDQAKFYLKVYKGEDEQNINVFADKFDTGKPKSDKPFLLNIGDILLVNSKVKIIDENLENPEIFVLTEINIDADNLKIKDADVSTDVKELSLKAKRGFEIKKLSSNFSYSLTKMSLMNLNLLSQESTINGNIELLYDEEKGMSDFVNTVIFKANLLDSKIATNDLNAFYNEFRKGELINFTGNIDGTLNNFTFSKADVSTKGISMKGEYVFKDLISSEKGFYIEAKNHNIITSSAALKRFLPSILGKTLPKQLDDLGRVKFKGNSIITSKNLETKSILSSAIGAAKTNIKIANYSDTENASYVGDVLLTNFNLGKLVGSEDLGTISSDLHIDGKGFTQESVNTELTGTIDSFWFKNYDYKNIVVSGDLKHPVFDGKLTIDDPNIKMDFTGLVNVSETTNKFDFEADVEFAELNQLHLMKRDSISIFAGNIKMNMNGKTLDNTYGTISFKQTFYQNQDEDYYFDDFNITSSKKGMKRIIEIDSPDILTGKIEGDFLIKDIPTLFVNGIGSIYTNYTPKEISTPNQYIDFNFLIYNKLIEIFVPQIQFGDNTKIEGTVFSDESKFTLQFDSPEMLIVKNYLGNVHLKLDNNNPEYNAKINIDSLYTGFYNLKDIRVLNTTENDTLHVNASFKGGKKKEDLFNLNLFHTINPEGKSVVGINKSDITYKDNVWYLNGKNDRKNKIVFDNSFKNINFEDIILNFNDEIISFSGSTQENSNKNLKVDFKNVDVGNLIPEIDSLQIRGNLNGNLSVVQHLGAYIPTSSLTIDDIDINDVSYGDLKINIDGNHDLTDYNLKMTLINETVKSVYAHGNINVAKKDPSINLNVAFEEFNLMAVSPFGGDVITDIRGLITGSAKITGKLKTPTVNGKFTLNKSGLRVPYLNVDFNLDDNTIITATSDKLSISKTHITDTKYNTAGELQGSFSHNNFGEWKIDLGLKTDNLLVLDTKQTEESLYYGTAFISGTVDMKGPTDELVINVDATTEKGTIFKIPLSNTESIGDNSFIHFISPKEKEARLRGETVITNKLKGLSLNFELDINNNAEVEIVIDPETKSALRGRGAGNLLLEINTLGKFNMWGDFVVYDGVYDFRYGKIIKREIEVERDGTITWDGSPGKAQLNLKAIYKTKANPSALLDDPTINRKIPVEVTIDLTKEISQPELLFDIQFPEVSSTVKNELDYKLQSEDERQNQALYLLTTGGFISTSAGENALTNTLNDGINALFAKILSDDDAIINITPYYDLGYDTAEVQTDDEFGFQFSSQISNRIIVNGRVGIPVGGLSETSVAGDVDVQWLVNEDGSLRINFFNRQSELQFIGEDQTFEQGAGISYSMDFNTFKELMDKIKGKARRQRKAAEDSINENKNEGPVMFKSKSQK